MASDAAIASDEDETQCGIINCTLCKKHFKKPRTLPCLHTFCRKCLRTHIEDLDGSEPKCTICGTVFSGSEKVIEGAGKDILITRLLECDNEEVEDVTCSLCNSDATEKCFHCCHYLCDRDAENHRKIPVTMNHTMVSLQEYKRMSASERLSLFPTKCSTHEDYTVEYFCSTCDTSVCMLCRLEGHDPTDGTHNLHNMNEVIQNDKKELTEEKSFVSTQYKKLRDAEKKVFETREKLGEAKEEAISTISKRSNELRQHIDRLQDELADEITAKYNTKVEVFDKQLDDMDRRMSELDMATIYIEALLECKNPEVFLDASKKWYDNFKEKKSGYEDVELDAIENAYLKAEVDEKSIEETVTSKTICNIVSTSAVACHSQLNGLSEEVEIGSDVKFCIIVRSNDDTKVALKGTSPEVEIISPSDQRTNLNGETTSECKFKYQWSPSSLGKHTLSAKIFDNEIKGSPVVIKVHPKNGKDRQQNQEQHKQQQKQGKDQESQLGDGRKKSGSKVSKSKPQEQRKPSWKK